MSSRKSLTTMFSVDILKSFTSSNRSAHDKYPQRITTKIKKEGITFEVFYLDFLICHYLLDSTILQLKLLFLKFLIFGKLSG